MAFYQLKQTQILPATIDQVWTFMAAPQNLKKITPDYMGFAITSQNLPDKMYPGMIVSYKVSPLLNIKMNWVTEITHVRYQQYFVDEQRMGPYSLWHHQHHFIETKEGIKMDDIVTYSPPLGPLGAAANHLIIRDKLNEIFDYRKTALNRKFGKMGTNA